MSDVWKLRLLPASFRGIPFYVDKHEFATGRQNVQHEPPDRDSVFAEDMGKKTDGYTLEGHILGDGYFLIRDALIRAMTDKGSGVLIHPYLGVKEVQPGEFTLREETAEGRMCRFTLQFFEAGDPSAPIAFIDKITTFLSSVSEAVAFVKNAFQLAFSLTALPAWVVATQKAILTETNDAITKGKNAVRANHDTLAKLTAGQNAMAKNADNLLNSPASLAETLDQLVVLMRDLPDDTTQTKKNNDGSVVSDERTTVDITSGRDDKLDGFTSLVTFESPTKGKLKTAPTTDTRQAELDNANALETLFKTLSVLRLAENTVIKTYTNTTDAVKQREVVISYIDSQLETSAIDDNVFQKLVDVKSKIAKAVPGSNLASIQSLSITDTTNTLLLAYDLYQDLSKELDIIERNSVENPMFIGGTIEVLSA
jgi:prophage DNA circulation protein